MTGGVKESDLLTFTIMAKLNGNTEDDVYTFFKTNLKGECTYKQAKQAVEDGNKLIQNLPPTPLTTAAVYGIASEFISERERIRLEELEKEREWDEPSTQYTRPSSSSSRDLLGISVARDDDEEVRLGIAASQLKPGEFLVQAICDWTEGDRNKQHPLRTKDLFVIVDVNGVDDGSDTAWFLGFKFGDPHEELKWIFSGYVRKVFAN